MTDCVSANEAAAKLGVHVATVYRWVRSGRLSGKKLVNGQLSIKAASVEKILKG